MSQNATASRLATSHEAGRRLPRSVPRGRSGERLALWTIRAAMVINVVFSISTFHESLVPATAANLQQYVALALWLVTIGASFAARPVLRLGFGTETLAVVAFYLLAIVSVIWSDLSPATLAKGVALSITTFGAYRLARSVSLDDIIDCTILGLSILGAASVLLVLFVPSIGVDDSWMHNGQWQGVFESKQALGTVGGFLAFHAFYRFLTRGGATVFAVTFALAAAAALGSGSRGGGAMALVACAVLYLCRRSTALPRWLAFGPLLMTALALVLLAYLYVTGYAYLPIGGERIDFTERTFIWQYALAHFGDRPVFGFGLNGFWSMDPIYHGFEREHGWVLDNYHNGYLAILVETGVVGMTLFTWAILLFGMKMAWLYAERGMRRADAVFIVGFMTLSFFIDFTETFFLRSTTWNSVLMVVFFFVAGRVPEMARAAEGFSARASRLARSRPRRTDLSRSSGTEA